jgi:hypothetical protein
MYYLLDDPWPLGLGLAVLGVVSLVAVRVTQRGKFLIWAGICLGLAALVFVVEALYVTDGERIEAVVSDIVQASARGDADAVLSHLTSDVLLEQGGDTFGEDRMKRLARLVGAELARGPVARQVIRGLLKDVTFDYLYITRLEVQANRLNRLGTADLRVHAMGSFQGPYARLNFATDAQGSDWSMGLEEAEPGVWKVNRITAVRVPGNAKLPGMGRRP